MGVAKQIQKLKEERSADIVEILEVMPHVPKEKIGLAIHMIEEKDKKNETERTQREKCCTQSSGLLAKIFGQPEQKAD